MIESLPNRLSADLDDAFVELVDEFGSMVLTLTTRLTDTPTGEDLAQETFLRAYRSLQQRDRRQIASLDLRPWLVTIARNLVRNEYRRRERKPSVSLDTTDMPDLATSAPGAIEAIDGRDGMADLLATLTDDQREAVVLRHVLGLPMREVALTMGCPVGTAKSHASRGIERLRGVVAGSVNTDVQHQARGASR